MMMYISITLFAIASAGGLIMVSIKMSDKVIPWFLAAGHGIFAAGGLTVLIMASIENPENILLVFSSLLFILTVGSGLKLFFEYVSKKPLPNYLITIHAFTAIVSYITLIIGFRLAR